jgi:glycosyltransferase involved in cell wall biosynthesis
MPSLDQLLAKSIPELKQRFVDRARPAQTPETEPVRVLLMLPSLHGGGAQRMAVHLLDHLDRSEFDTHIGLLRLSGPYLSSLKEPERVHVPPIFGRLIDPDLGAAAIYKPWRLLLGLILAPLSVFHLLRQVRPHLIVTFLKGTSFATVPAVWAYGRNRVRWIAREGNNAMAVLDDEISNTLVRRFMGGVLRHCYSLADCVLTISEDLGAGLSQRFDLPPARIATIYNAVDLASAQRQAALPLPPDAPVDDPYIVSIGRLERQKGYDLLLKAYAASRARSNLKLVILGEGKELNALREQAAQLGISDRVHWIGFCDNPWAYAARAKMFVLASRWEGFGNVVVEAMACKVPVIVTDCDFGPREIVTDGEDGLVVASESVTELRDAIDRCFEDEQLRRRFIMRGLERAFDFDVSRIAAQYADLIRSEVKRLPQESQPQPQPGRPVKEDADVLSSELA